MANLPDFVSAPATLATLPFKQNSATGTYYHNRLNLSFKLVKDAGEPACSLVYGTTEEGEGAVLAFGNTLNAVAGDRPADVALDIDRGPDGLNYFNARATAQQ